MNQKPSLRLTYYRRLRSKGTNVREQASRWGENCSGIAGQHRPNGAQRPRVVRVGAASAHVSARYWVTCRVAQVCPTVVVGALMIVIAPRRLPLLSGSQDRSVGMSRMRGRDPGNWFGKEVEKTGVKADLKGVMRGRRFALIKTASCFASIADKFVFASPMRAAGGRANSINRFRWVVTMVLLGKCYLPSDTGVLPARLERGGSERPQREPRTRGEVFGVAASVGRSRIVGTR